MTQIDHWEALFDKNYMRWFVLHGDPADALNSEAERIVFLHLDQLSDEFHAQFTVASSGKRFPILRGDTDYNLTRTIGHGHTTIGGRNQSRNHRKVVKVQGTGVHTNQQFAGSGDRVIPVLDFNVLKATWFDGCYFHTDSCYF